MLEKLDLIGIEMAEDEANELSEYYFDNEYYHKAKSFDRDHRELFFIGRTGSGKSAILAMIRNNQRDSSRVISITGDEFALDVLLHSEEISAIPESRRLLAFKSLWKYIIIVNILKNIYGRENNQWISFLYGNNREGYNLLNKFEELSTEGETRSLTNQVILFLNQIQKVIQNNQTANAELYRLFDFLKQFEKHELKKHVKGKYLYILIDDLDRNWSSTTRDNNSFISSLFECIIEMGRAFYENIRFVVALRTDIFRQIEFHQTEKIHQYVIDIRWNNWQLQRIVEGRLIALWDVTLEEARSRFPREIEIHGKKETDIFEFLISRTMRRPRDIISFINLCIREANFRGSKSISEKDVLSAEKVYSRRRITALVDEWKFVYPKLKDWIELFAGQKFIIDYSGISQIFNGEKEPIKKIIDILYEVGFLGYLSSDDRNEIKFSFLSKGAPGYDHRYYVHFAFYSYLKERAEELGRN
jgi:ABC-type lipoprotein export system ATPase subunit